MTVPTPSTLPVPEAELVVGRYVLYEELAAGGMASIHFGRLLGDAGFARTVAIKRMHAHYVRESEFVAMFLDEAHVVARIRHPNVVPTLDVVSTGKELLLVLEYVHGEPLSGLLRAGRGREPMPARIATSIVVGALHGLHAAHEARDEEGRGLNLVHRDISPQNILVGADGMARVLDFGVARATGRVQTTRDGSIKGKLGYMAPEQLRGEPVTRQADIYSAGVVLWEALTGERLFGSNVDALVVVARMTQQAVDAPSTRSPALPEALDAAVLRALAPTAGDRYETARAMAVEVEKAVPPATQAEVAEWVERAAGDTLKRRAAQLTRIEQRAKSATVHERREVVAELTPLSKRTGHGSRERPTGGPVTEALSPFTTAPAAAEPGVHDLAIEAPRKPTRSHTRALAVLFAMMVAGALVVVGVLGARARRSSAPPVSVSTSPAATLSTDAPPAASRPSDPQSTSATSGVSATSSARTAAPTRIAQPPRARSGSSPKPSSVLEGLDDKRQ